MVLGLVLLAAALMKARQWAVDPYSPSGVPHIPILRVAAVNAELALAFWLLSGVSPHSARAAAVACFTVFGAVATQDALAGESSCGCFGSLRVHPWLTAGFDLVAIACLAGVAPRRHRATHFQVGLVLAVLCTTSLAVTWPIVRAANQPRLVVTPAAIDLGPVRPRESQRAGLTVVNTGGAPVELAAVTTTCSCVAIILPRGVLAPGETRAGEIVFDPKARPDFSGRLSVMVSGTDKSGTTVFTLTVSAAILDR